MFFDWLLLKLSFVKLPSTHFLNFIFLVCCCFILSVLETFFCIEAVLIVFLGETAVPGEGHCHGTLLGL